MITPEQRERDGRLAWMLVLASGAVTLALLGALAFAGWSAAMRWAEEQQRQIRAGARDGERAREAADAWQPCPPITPPPNTAKPIGAVASWIGTNDYPAAAIRAGAEGRVRVTLAIGADGAPTGCSVAQSSGSWSLDNGTCLVMMKRGRFDRAAPGSAGARPGTVRRWTSPPVRWVLPR